MAEVLKQKVMEYVAIASECPEPFRVKCFELLFGDYLERGRLLIAQKEKKEDPVLKKKKEEEILDKKNGEVPSQEDIFEKDLHVKARQFMKKCGLSIDDINELFYKEDNKFLPLYDDLKTEGTSESQIRIALLHALVNGMQVGSFEFDGEAVREEAKIRKCYDQANFSRIFNNNKGLFEGYDKYDKKQQIIKLSGEGKNKLAEIIKGLK